MKRTVVFDFDGTYLRHDSLPLFLQHAFGRWRYWWGVLLCLPWIVAWKLRLLDAGKAKERLIGHFVEGLTTEEFSHLCTSFYHKHHHLVEPQAQTAMLRALNAGDQVVVLTASVRDWVEPWFADSDVTVIGTELEVDGDGRLTGRFATPNCKGPEKWRRLLEAVPNVEQRPLVAYGDSRGDRELLDHADEPYYRSFTVTRDKLPYFERHPGRLFGSVLVLLILYQLLGVFFGMDLADAGFYLAFYDNIFTHPESVEYNFMYYLSGIAGGTLQWLFPSMGMAGMRIAGIAMNTLCALMLWFALRRHIDERALALGCALVVVTFIAPPYTLSYDLCTIVLYVAAITIWWKALRTDNLILTMLAGVLAGLNVLVRIPNVLGLSMALLPLIITIFSKQRHRRWSKAIASSSLFLTASALAVGFVLMIMPHDHYQALVNVINDLRTIANDTSGTASHTTGQMMMTQLRFYGTSAWTAVKLSVPVAACWWATTHCRQRLVSITVILAAVALMVWFTARMHPLEPLWVMCMAGCVAVMVADRGQWLTWLAVLGLGMMLIMPMGSDGAYNNGSIVCWVAAPVAAIWWLRRSRIALPATLLAVCAVRMVAGGAYFDGGPLLDKRYTVDHPRAAYIHTTRERAEAITTVLRGIEPHIKPGTTLMAYGSIPAMNYLTHTHPYLGCSWVEQLSAAMLSQRLEEAAQSELPPVLQQKFNTLGPQWGQPSEQFLTDYGTQNTYQDNRKLQVLNTWLHEHHYRPVYSDPYFVLYKAQD